MVRVRIWFGLVMMFGAIGFGVIIWSGHVSQSDTTPLVIAVGLAVCMAIMLVGMFRALRDEQARMFAEMFSTHPSRIEEERRRAILRRRHK